MLISLLFFFFSCSTTKALYDNRSGANIFREDYGRLENEERGFAEDFNENAISTDEAKSQATEEGSLIEKLKELIRQIRNRDSQENKLPHIRK